MHDFSQRHGAGFTCTRVRHGRLSNPPREREQAVDASAQCGIEWGGVAAARLREE